MENELKVTLDMIKSISRASSIKVNRNFRDFFSDRIIQALSQPTLLSAMETLAASVDVDLKFLNGETVSSFVKMITKTSGQAPLLWMRKHPKIAAMVVALKDEEYNDVAGGLVAPEVPSRASATVPKPQYGIAITATTVSPLAHGSDIKAGNATLFRRRQVITPGGAVMDLPYYAGNALRGQMRDLLADDFLSVLGLSTDRSKPSISLWFFHAIYAGGVLDESGAKITAKLEAALGKNGSLRTDGIRMLRNMLPALSMLGSAMGNRIIGGRICVGDLRPGCIEWGGGYLSANELTEHLFLTRRDDYESRKEEDKHAGMIATTECLKEGVLLFGGIDLSSHATEMERSALGRGLELLTQRGLLGANNNRGFGKIILSIENAPDPVPYTDYLKNNRDDIVVYLKSIDAISKDFDVDATPGGPF